ncbi:MAG: molybdenum cofactor guanylyltransferase [Deltaproteobacteria bacterium]|nr:molybdenum cofactor guanylyltransferase [Deltaproteobacteria bacterium]
MKMIKDVAGVILAGGKSLRYGRNKALVKIDGIPLIERVIHVMRSLFRHLILITNTPDDYAYLKLPMHEDLIKGLGPLGGIFTALMTIKNQAGFFVACDMPNLNRELIHYMVEIRCDFDAVVPRLQEGTEALHALYGKRCLPPIKHLIDSSQYQIFRFFPKVSVRYVDENEIRRFDPQLESFFNINKPGAIKKGKLSIKPD